MSFADYIEQHTYACSVCGSVCLGFKEIDPRCGNCVVNEILQLPPAAAKGAQRG